MRYLTFYFPVPGYLEGDCKRVFTLPVSVQWRKQEMVEVAATFGFVSNATRVGAGLEGTRRLATTFGIPLHRRLLGSALASSTDLCAHVAAPTHHTALNALLLFSISTFPFSSLSMRNVSLSFSQGHSHYRIGRQGASPFHTYTSTFPPGSGPRH